MKDSLGEGDFKNNDKAMVYNILHKKKLQRAIDDIKKYGYYFFLK